MNMADAVEQWRLQLVGEAETARLAGLVADFLGAGDLVTLTGDLGAGKTTFARALIRTVTGDPELEAPSPTFTLMQIYESARFPIVHADLYRIAAPEELTELGWEEATERALVLVEWAERAGDALPGDRLDVALAASSDGEDKREAVLTGYGSFAPRLARARGADAVLRKAGWDKAAREFMLGDASTRAYERLKKPDGAQAILMISPPRPDGPPVRFGKPYSAIARLAENIIPFIAIDQSLRGKGLSAPEIYAHDLENGFAVLEDLGSAGVVDSNGPIPDRYGQAVAVLAHLHGQTLPETIASPDGGAYQIPPYDLEALAIEAELLADWYVPHIAKAQIASGHRASFSNLWRYLCNEVAHGSPLYRPTWVLRDYHSPNLIWLEKREGLKKIGLIDFQDCVMGHPAYDVVSLLQDARVTVPDDLELRLLGLYAQLRKKADPNFDMSAFARAYAILGAQRATKILGIFARLDKRDGKPGYLKHIPRVRGYLRKNLAHPALAQIHEWHEAHSPRLLSDED
jgi:hypothetical protein